MILMKKQISKGQVTMELTIGIIAVIIFLLGMSNAWVWFNKCLVERQEAYQDSRLDPTKGETYAYQDYYTPAALETLSK